MNSSNICISRSTVDWKAKVRENAQEDWREGCGPFCNPETNERGLKLLDFATYNNLVLANTLGNHKPSRRWTWPSPDGTHYNHIDYILVKKRFRSGIKTARTRTFQVQMLEATMTWWSWLSRHASWIPGNQPSQESGLTSRSCMIQ